MRYPSCLPVAPSVMEVTDSSLETGREESKEMETEYSTDPRDRYKDRTSPGRKENSKKILPED